MTAKQMIKRICGSWKLEHLPQKKEDELLSWNKTDSEFIFILTMWATINNLEFKWAIELAQAQVPIIVFIDEERNLLAEIKKIL